MSVSLLQLETLPRVAEALSEFVGGDPGRSLLIRPLAGATGEIAVREDEPRPGASLLKLPLIAAVYDAAAEGVIDLDQPVPLSQMPSTLYPTVLAAFEHDRSLTIGELSRLVLVTSDNPAADFLLRRVGVARVNRRIESLGCEVTRLRSGFSDDELGETGRANVTTAREALTILLEMLNNPAYNGVSEALRNNLRNVRIPLRLPDETPVRHKTGTLLGVVNDVGVISGERVHLAVSVLSDGQPDTARTSIQIGDLVAQVWQALGEQIEC